MDRTLQQLLNPRARGSASPEADPLPARQLAVILIMGGAFYGAIMGSYSVTTGGSPAQILFSAVKVPLFLAATAAICLPAVWMIYTLQGLQRDFKQSMRAILEGQAALATVLGALAPFTLVLYLSGVEYRPALLANVAVFALASILAQDVIRRNLAALIKQDRRHLILLRVWFGIFAFVGVQLAWNLRPFIGKPGSAAEFFRPDAWTNAYVAMFRLMGF